MRLDTEVVVVGAGPAGCAAAITLALRGVRVALVDRAHFPRAKVCGDGLTPRALAALERLGAWGRVEPHAQLVESLRTVDLRTGVSWMGPIPSRLSSRADKGAVVRRDLLDHALCQRAVEVGASFHGGVTVGHVEQTGPAQCVVNGITGVDPWECSSRAVIVAEGATGKLATQVGVSRLARVEGIALRQYWRCLSPAPVTFTICVPIESRERSYAGYGWIFPVSADIANVGVGLYGVRDGRELRLAYGAFLQRIREVDPEWRPVEPCGNARGGVLRSGATLSDLVHGRIVLAGEAAGVTNPFTGEGIAQALDSGELSALSVIDEFETSGRLALSIAQRMREAFPQTTRVAEQLPWMLSRGADFVAEFWGAVSFPETLIGRAARRVALEEHLCARGGEEDQHTRRTWMQIGDSIAIEFPLLTQLLEAVRAESNVSVDVPLQVFWEEHGKDRFTRIPEIDDIAQLLSLAILMCVIAGQTHAKRRQPTSGAAPESAVWAVYAVTLGAVDILMAYFFEVAARVPARVSVDCGIALSRTFLALCGRTGPDLGHGRALESLLHDLASDFGAAARTCVARAA